MKRVILSTILLLLVSVAYCQDQPLQFTIKSDKEVYEVGEEIKLTFTFRNNGPEDILFCRFLLKYNLLKRNIKLKNQEGELYEVLDLIELEMPSIEKEDFIILRSKQEYVIELQFDTSLPSDSSLVYLNHNQRMLRELPSGIYEITAIYKNNLNYFHGNEIKNGITNKIPLENTWTGTLTSNTIAIEVKEKK